MSLADARVRNTRPGPKPMKLADGGGVYLEVRPTGAKLWRFRYRIAGKENVFAIGDYPGIALAEVRIEHGKARALVKQSIHPSHCRQAERLSTHAANANTFEAVAKEWISKRSAGWSSYCLRQVERFLEIGVFPYVGKLPIRSVTAAHLLDVIRRIEGRGPQRLPCWFDSGLRPSSGMPLPRCALMVTLPPH